MSRNGSVVTGPAAHARGRSTRPTGREVRALVWLLRHPLITLVPLPRSLAAAVWWGARPVAVTVGRAAGGAAGVVAGAPRLVRPVRRPPDPVGVAAVDGLPRPALAAPARRLRAHPRPPPHRRHAVPARPAGPLGHPVDRHPGRADGPRAGPADLDRPHPRPRRSPAGRTGSPSPAAAPACSPWSWSGAMPFPHVLDAALIPDTAGRGRPVPARCRRQRVRQPVPAQPARQAPARRRRLRRGQVVACCGTRCARPGR